MTRERERVDKDEDDSAGQPQRTLEVQNSSVLQICIARGTKGEASLRKCA